MGNCCDGCIYLKESPRVSYRYTCQHVAFLYVQTSIVEYLYAAQAHTVECGQTNMPAPPDLNEIAYMCKHLPEIGVEMVDDYSGEGRNQWPFRYLLEEVKTCTGKKENK